MSDPITGRASQAVVTEPSEERIVLMSRQGRAITFPRQSFLTLWNYTLEAPDTPCDHQGCEELGYLRVQQLGRWVAVCRAHLPPLSRPLLPGDEPSDSTEGLDQCPVCRASQRTEGSSVEQSASGWNLNRCGSCGVMWCHLLAPGEPHDGLTFADAMQDVAAHLESEGLQARVMAGPVAYQNICRAAGTTPRTNGVVRIVGIEMVCSSERSIGTANIVILGERPRTGIQRLGGSPDRVQEAEPTATAAPPHVGTVWRYRGGDGVQLIFVEGVSNRYANRRRQVIVTVRDVDHEGNLLGTPRTVTNEEFHRSFSGSLAVDVAGFNSKPAEPPRVVRKSTWWRKSDQLAVEIEAVETNEGTVFVSFVGFPEEGEGPVPDGRLTLEDFLEAFQDEDPDPPCEVGDELEDTQGRNIIVSEVLPRDAVIAAHHPNSPQRQFIISFRNVREKYRKVDRRSAFDRLLDDGS